LRVRVMMTWQMNVLRGRLLDNKNMTWKDDMDNFETGVECRRGGQRGACAIGRRIACFEPAVPAFPSACRSFAILI
jgi:hypothetical protein